MHDLKSHEPGTRVRITFEGIVLAHMSDGEVFRVSPDGESGGEGLWFVRESFEAPTFQIERVEPPLKAGDRVEHYRGGYDLTKGTLLVFASDGRAVVEFDSPSSLGITALPVTCLERIA